MANAKFTVTSKLMQNYETGSPVDYHNAIAATSDGSGNLLFFSIGSDGHIYAFISADDTPTGWRRTDLSQGMDDLTAILLAAEQDENGAPLLAAVMQSNSTHEYSVFFTKDFAAATGKGRWVFRGKKGDTRVTDIAAGHGKGGAVLIVITTQQNDRSTNFLVNPNLNDQSWFWREVPSPVNSQRVISTAIGHNSRLESIDEVQGLLYSLYQTGDGGETWMVVTSLPDFTFYNHAIPLDFNPTAFGVTRGAQGDTELIVGDTKLYHLPPQIQTARDADQVRQGLDPATTQPTTHDIKTIEAGAMQDGSLEAWFLTEDGTLSRTYQGGDQQWVSPLPFHTQVGEMVAWRSDDKSLHEIFTVDLDDRLQRYRQDPKTMLWKGFDILVESLDTHREVQTYVTQLQITDQNGAPMANQNVTVRASELTPLKINHSVYYAEPDPGGVVCQTDVLGNLTIENKVEGLSTPTLRLQADVLGSQLIDVDPAAEVRQKLSTLTVDQLQNAQMQTNTIGVTQPMLPGKSQDDLQGAHQALEQLTSNQLPSQNDFQPTGDKPVQFVARAAGTPMLNRVAYGALAPDYRWGLDLTGANPHFTTDQSQIEQVHLAKLDTPTTAAALAARSVLDDVEHFFGDVWHAIENGLIEAEHWVVQKVSDGIQLVISTAEKAYTVVVKFAEQVWSVIEYVFKQIGAFFGNLVRWLGFIFSWKDILRTHDVIRTTINHGFDKFVGELTNAEDRIHQVFTELKNRITGDALPGQPGTWAQGDVTSVNTTGGHASPLNSPDTNWALHHATSGSLVEHGDATPPSSSFSLSEAIQQDIDQLKTLFNKAVDDLVHQRITIAQFLEQLLEVFEVAVIDTVETAVLGMVEVVKLAVGAIKDVLNTEWNIPLISPLYAEITNGSKLTLLDLASLLAAIPATVLYKLATNEAPFSESVAGTLTQTKSMDDLLTAITTLDGKVTSGPVAVRRLYALDDLAGEDAEGDHPEPPERGRQPHGDQKKPQPPSDKDNQQNILPPIGARGVSYAFGFAVGVSWIVYGVTNGVMLPLKPNRLPPADKVKLATGLIVNVLSFVPMALVLHYGEDDIPKGSKADLPRLRYEMFITTFQVLFNVKDGLMVAWRDPEGWIDFTTPFLDFFETVLGGFNFIWFFTLAIAEGVEGDMTTSNGLKIPQNIGASITQILSLPGDIIEEPISKGILTATQTVLGATPGIITCVRTGLDIHINDIETIR